MCLSPHRLLAGPLACVILQWSLYLHPVTTLPSLSKVIGQLCATTCLFDPVPTALWKTVSPAPLPFILSLINTSLSSGYMPLRLKEIVVTKHTHKKKKERERRNNIKYSCKPLLFQLTNTN